MKKTEREEGAEEERESIYQGDLHPRDKLGKKEERHVLSLTHPRSRSQEENRKDCVLKAKGFLPVYMISDLLADIGVGIFVCILLVVLGLQIHGAVRNVKVSYSKKHD